MITQMRTKQKLYILSLSHTCDAQMRTTCNISHIPSITNDLRKCVLNKSSTLSLFSYSHTHDDIRNCVPHTISHIQCIKTMQFVIRIYT